MRRHSMFSVIVITVFSICLTAEGKRITLVPLSSTEVYRLLREIGREDAVPEGRVVTQGIAAVSGFALGLAKGIGGSLLVDLATNLWSETNQNQYQTRNRTVEAQEICFNSRSLDEINDDDTPQGRQNTVTGSDVTGAGVSDYYTTTNNANDAYDDGDNTDTQTYSTTQTGTGGELNCLVVQGPPTNS